MLQPIQPKTYLSADTAKRFAEKIAAKHAAHLMYEDSNTNLILAYGAAAAPDRDLEGVFRLLSAALELMGSKLRFFAYRTEVNLLSSVKLMIAQAGYRNGVSRQLGVLTEIYNTLVGMLTHGTYQAAVVQMCRFRLEQQLTALESSHTSGGGAYRPANGLISQPYTAAFYSINGNFLRLMRREIRRLAQFRQDTAYLQLISQKAVASIQSIESRQSAIYFAEHLTEAQKAALNQWVLEKNLFSWQRNAPGYQKSHIDIANLLKQATRLEREQFFLELKKESQKGAQQLFQNQTELERFLLSASEEEISQYFETVFQSGELTANKMQLLQRVSRVFRDRNAELRQFQEQLERHFHKTRQAVSTAISQDPTFSTTYFLEHISGMLAEHYLDFLMEHSFAGLGAEEITDLREYLTQNQLETVAFHLGRRNNLSVSASFSEKWQALWQEFPQDGKKFAMELSEYAVQQAIPLTLHLLSQEDGVSMSADTYIQWGKDAAAALSAYIHAEKLEQFCNVHAQWLTALGVSQTDEVTAKLAAVLLCSPDPAGDVLSAFVPDPIIQQQEFFHMLRTAKEQFVQIQEGFRMELSQSLTNVLQQRGGAHPDLICNLTIHAAQDRRRFSNLPQRFGTALFSLLLERTVAVQQKDRKTKSVVQMLRQAVSLERTLGQQQLQNCLISYNITAAEFVAQMKRHITELDHVSLNAFGEYLVSVMQEQMADSVGDSPLSELTEQLERILYRDRSSSNTVAAQQLSVVFTQFWKEKDAAALVPQYSAFFSLRVNDKSALVFDFLRTVSPYDLETQQQVLQLFSEIHEELLESTQETIQLRQLHQKEIQKILRKTALGWEFCRYDISAALDEVFREDFRIVVQEQWSDLICDTVYRVLDNCCGKDETFRQKIFSRLIAEEAAACLETRAQPENGTVDEIFPLLEGCPQLTFVKSYAEEHGMADVYQQMLQEIASHLSESVFSFKTTADLQKKVTERIAFFLAENSLLKSFSHSMNAVNQGFTLQTAVETYLHHEAEHLTTEIVEQIRPEILAETQILPAIVSQVEQKVQCFLACEAPQLHTLVSRLVETQITDQASAQQLLMPFIQRGLVEAYRTETLSSVTERSVMGFGGTLLHAFQQYEVEVNASAACDTLLRQCQKWVQKLVFSSETEEHIQSVEEIKRLFQENDLWNRYLLHVTQNQALFSAMKNEVAFETIDVVKETISTVSRHEKSSFAELLKNAFAQSAVYLSGKPDAVQLTVLVDSDEWTQLKQIETAVESGIVWLENGLPVRTFAAELWQAVLQSSVVFEKTMLQEENSFFQRLSKFVREQNRSRESQQLSEQRWKVQEQYRSNLQRQTNEYFYFAHTWLAQLLSDVSSGQHGYAIATPDSPQQPFDTAEQAEMFGQQFSASHLSYTAAWTQLFQAFSQEEMAAIGSDDRIAVHQLKHREQQGRSVAEGVPLAKHAVASAARQLLTLRMSDAAYGKSEQRAAFSHTVQVHLFRQVQLHMKTAGEKASIAVLKPSSFRMYQRQYDILHLQDAEANGASISNIQLEPTYSLEPAPDAAHLHYAFQVAGEYGHEAKRDDQTTGLQRQLDQISRKVDALQTEQKILSQNVIRKSDKAALEREFTQKIENDIYLAGKRHGFLP